MSLATAYQSTGVVSVVSDIGNTLNVIKGDGGAIPAADFVEGEILIGHFQSARPGPPKRISSMESLSTPANSSVTSTDITWPSSSVAPLLSGLGLEKAGPSTSASTVARSLPEVKATREPAATAMMGRGAGIIRLESSGSSIMASGRRAFCAGSPQPSGRRRRQ